MRAALDRTGKGREGPCRRCWHCREVRWPFPLTMWLENVGIRAEDIKESGQWTKKFQQEGEEKLLAAIAVGLLGYLWKQVRNGNGISWTYTWTMRFCYCYYIAKLKKEHWMRMPTLSLVWKACPHFYLNVALKGQAALVYCQLDLTEYIHTCLVMANV